MDGTLIFSISMLVCVVSGVISHNVLDYKKTCLEYKAKENEHSHEIPLGNIQLEIEKQKTEQLKIKAAYREKHGTTLYN